MAVRIRITNKPAGLARFYEMPKRQGRYRLVPVFHATLAFEDSTFEFSVTRDTITEVFEIGDTSPCPPTKPRKPYHAWIRTEGGRFRLQLHEPKIDDKYALKGDGDIIRRFIQIHHGPAMSTGCLMVGGGKKGYSRFKNALERMTGNDPKKTILVYIQKR